MATLEQISGRYLPFSFIRYTYKKRAGWSFTWYYPYIRIHSNEYRKTVDLFYKSKEKDVRMIKWYAKPLEFLIKKGWVKDEEDFLRQRKEIKDRIDGKFYRVIF